MIEFDKKAHELLGQILQERNIPNDKGYRLDKKEWAAEALQRLGYEELAEAISRRKGRPPKGMMSAKSAIEALHNNADPTLRHLGYFIDPPRPNKLTDQRVLARLVEEEMKTFGLEYQQAAYQVSKRLNEWPTQKLNKENRWEHQDIKKAYEREFKK